MKQSLNPLKRIALGIGFCPFWWQWGNATSWSDQRMWALGPFRFSYRSWR